MEELMLPSVTKYIRGLLVRTDFILKIAVMIASAAAVAAIVEEGFSESNSKRVCDAAYPTMDDGDDNGREEAPRVCNNGLATAITSIFTAAVVLQLEVLRPCFLSNSWKRLVLSVSIMFEVVSAVLWGISSALLTELYWSYCEVKEENGEKCGSKDQRFIAVPILGFVCLGGWFILTVIAVLRLIFKKY